MKPKLYNIEELRCNAFARAGKHFDMVRTEDFMRETHGFTFPHQHNYYMILLATEGKGQQIIDFESFPVEPGMLFLMYPGMIHAWESIEDLKGFQIFFTAEFFTQRYNNNNLFDFPFFGSGSVLPFVKLQSEAFSRLSVLFQQMLEEYEEGGTDLTSVLRSFLNIILIHAKRIYGLENTVPGKEHHSRQLVKRFEQLIDRHFRGKRLVKDYAQLLHITPNYLNVICRSEIGKSAGELIRERVMLEAKRMLTHDERTVSEIGHELNFDDNAYFCRFFKKYAGSSPDKFRRQMLTDR